MKEAVWTKLIPQALAVCLALPGLTTAADEIDDAIVRLLEGADAASFKDKATGAVLKLSEAEKLATDNDPVAKGLRERSAGLVVRSEAATELSDPKLKFGVSEYPLRTSETDEEPVRLVLGIQQAVMPSARREAESAQLRFMGQVQDARAQNQRLAVLRAVRSAWLNIYRQYHTALILRQSQKLFSQLVQITQYQYRAGSGTQQDVLQAQLELSLLKDKEAQAEIARETALADLLKWTGPAILNRALELESLNLPPLVEKARIEQGLDTHPLILSSKLETDAAKAGVEVTRSRARREWMWEVEAEWMYTKNEGFQNDKIALIATVDFFWSKKTRQDRWLAAEEKEYNAMVFTLSDERRELKRMLDAEYAGWKRLDDRLAFYRDTVLAQGAQNAQAALKAYQSQVTDFGELMRARQMELSSKLDALQMLVDRAMAHVNLLYLAKEGI